MDTSDSRSREEAYNGIRFLVGRYITNDVWRVEWRCLMRGCRGHDVAIAPNNREDAENAAIAQMQAHSEKPHTVAQRISTTTPPRRRRYQFSLMTMLIIMVLSSAAFGWWVQRSREWITQRHEWLAIHGFDPETNSSGLAEIVRMQAKAIFTLEPSAPGGLWLLGEKGLGVVQVGTREDEQEAKRLFPEAVVHLIELPSVE